MKVCKATPDARIPKDILKTPWQVTFGHLHSQCILQIHTRSAFDALRGTCPLLNLDHCILWG